MGLRPPGLWPVLPRKAKPSLHLSIQLRQPFPFDKEAAEGGDLLEQMMPAQRRAKVILAGAASRPDAGADHTMYHAHMPVTPGTQLLVYFQQLIQYLEG